jgi:hypothetical protein
MSMPGAAVACWTAAATGGGEDLLRPKKHMSGSQKCFLRGGSWRSYAHRAGQNG